MRAEYIEFCLGESGVRVYMGGGIEYACIEFCLGKSVEEHRARVRGRVRGR